ncbi:MAG: hypothetical protein JO341_04885 [Gammaproteobacteria bacterium]|nr:hypothetical protein [Gammaproteobacteria bacterium]
MSSRAFGLAALALLLITLAPSGASANGPPPFRDFASYVKWVQSLHRAPFDRDGAAVPPGGAQKLMRAQAAAHAGPASAAAAAALYHNVKVNQDRNPWPKAEIGAAVDPVSGSWVVMSNDFRRNFDQEFFHVSTDNGATWTDDAMTGGSDPFTGFIPSTFQSDPGVSFDRSGNSYLTAITGNLIFDGTNGYVNDDTEVDVVQGFADGTYASLIPTPVDVQPCNGNLSGTVSCDATLDKELVTTDTNPNSPHNGTTYVYYTLFCNTPTSGVCTDGHAAIPSMTSSIVEVHSAGAGLPFSAPKVVSGHLHQTQFSSMVIDSAGTPHMFFDDFSDPSGVVHMWESTLVAGAWVVGAQPVVSFVFNGLNNLNWAFRDAGAQAPGCGIHHYTAYCAFSANQVDGGKAESTPSVYLVTVPLSGAPRVVRVNDDAFGGQKQHFFAWATATPNGSVYVGWYDDRHDPFNTRVDYFVGRSMDGGKTFPLQQAVNDVAFNPCTGFPGCGFFGDYTQLVSGSDGVVRAAWSDTRDGASMQIWSQVLGF